MPARKRSEKVKEPMSGESSKESERIDSASMVSRETQEHLIRAGSEFFLAVESMMPIRTVPPEVRQHARAAKKEMLLTARAMIDARIAECDAPKSRAPILKKIELD
jgi:hypothetical protein